MADKDLQSLHPTQRGVGKYEERFIIKRFDDEPIEITLTERNLALKVIDSGGRFIQVGKYTLMANGIKSIDPKWGKDNIPPRPQEQYDYSEPDGNTMKGKLLNKEELDEWDSLFGGKKEY